MTTLTNGSSELRERLAAARDQVRHLRTERGEATQDADQARQRLVDSGGKPDINDPAFLAAEAAQKRVKDVDGRLALAQQAETGFLSLLAGGDGEPSWNFLDDQETTSQLRAWARSSAPIPQTPLGAFLTREQLAARFGRAVAGGFHERPALTGDALAMMAAITDSAGQGMYRGRPHGITPQLTPRTRFTDMLPAIPVTEGKTYDFTVETFSLAASGGAAETPEGQLKPELAATYTDAAAPMPTIAGWTKINRQRLADSDDLRIRLNNRLTFAVEWRYEAQAINGDGQGENVLGILNTPGVPTIPFSGSTFAGDQILNGIGEVLLAGAQPNICALAVRDWIELLQVKASGSGEYLSAGAFAQMATALWGVEVVPVPGLAQGMALVGDTTIGARALVREGVHVVAGTESDDVTRNRLTLLGEARLGLAVEVPSAWIKVDLAA